MYRHRFGLTGHPIPKDAQGKTFFEKTPGYTKLKRDFQRLIDDGGVGVVTAEAGVGKTAALRNLCSQLPKPDYTVLYLCDTAVSPLDLYRTLAVEIGVRPSHRRAQLWVDIKKTLIHMVDERGICPVIIFDEAQHLSDKFLIDLSGFLNFAFDSRDLLTLWLAGLSTFRKHLQMQVHAALKTRVVAEVHLDPLDRETFSLFLDHGLKSAGATSKLLAEPAIELLFRASRGVPRVASKLLRGALRAAHERDQSFIDEHIVDIAIDELNPPTAGKSS
jgi:type II secretory pathway predicted ATPase ExeA